MRFTVRRPPIGEVSPCGHRSSGGDVACSVDVGVAPWRSAGFALENRLALAVPGSDMPTDRTSLRRIRSRNLLDPTMSLVLQPRGEQPPTAAANRPVQPTLLGNPRAGLLYGSPRAACHRPHVKGLDPDGVEAPRNVRGDFLDPVLAPVGLTRLQLRDRQLCSGAPVRATLGPGQPLLQDFQPLGFTSTQSGGVQQFAGGQRRRHGNAAVDTDDASVARTGDGVGYVGERDMPASRPIPSHPVGLDARGHGSRQAKTHPAHLGHPDPTETAVQTLDMMRFEGDLPKPLMHTRFAPCRATVSAGEKVLHSLREIPQRLLLQRLTPGTKPPVFGASLSQLRALFQVGGSLAPRLPVLLLLDGQVPHIPGLAAMIGQRRRLIGGRKQSVSRHPGNVTTSTDKLRKGDAAFPPSADARGFYAARIR
ncbi:MAG: hypothetical protein JWR34_2247 [Mycobacterium sp.]|nr:hypothetical protein [Mycobacterium sp.]